MAQGAGDGVRPTWRVYWMVTACEAKDALSPNISAPLPANVCTKDGQPGTRSSYVNHYYNQWQPRLPRGSFLQPGFPWQGVRDWGGGRWRGGGVHLSRWLPLQWPNTEKMKGVRNLSCEQAGTPSNFSSPPSTFHCTWNIVAAQKII